MNDFWPFIFSVIEKLSILLLPDNDISGKLPWSVKKVINIEVPVFEHRVSVLFFDNFLIYLSIYLLVYLLTYLLIHSRNS